MSNLQAALNLARSGYYVHPLRERDKIPLAPHGSNDATRDEDTIRAWWENKPNANIGISLDKSGIVDIAPDCPEYAARFEANGLPPTTCYSSGGGEGHTHNWYRLPPGAPVARSCISGQYDIMSQGNAVAPGSVHPSGRAYEWNTPLVPVEDLPLAPAWAVALLQAKPEGTHDDADWIDLPSGAQEAHKARFQKLCKANKDLRDVCAGNAVTLITKAGAKDDSVSAQRSVFVNQLLRARYLHRDIRALARHFSGVLDSGHGDRAFEADIDRLLIRYTPKDYKPEPTRGAQAPRGGRHYELTDGEFLERCHMLADCGPLGIVLDWTRAELASHFHVSYGTIQRIETRLIDDGSLRRIVSDDRQRSSLLLSPVTSDMIVMRCDQTYSEEGIDVRSQFDPAHSDAENEPEMSVCEEQARVLEITHPPVSPTPRVLRCGPWYFVADGVRCGASASTEAEAWAAWGVCILHTQAPAESLVPEGVCILHTPDPAESLEPEGACILHTPDPAESLEPEGACILQALSPAESETEPVAAEAASFTPIELPDKPYTAHSKHLMGNTERYKLIWATMRQRADDDASATQAMQLDLAAVLSQGECVISRANGPPGASTFQRQTAFL